VELRPTTIADAAGVSAWERHPENAPYVEAWPAERHCAALDDPDVRHFIIEASGVPAGFLILAGITDRSSVLELRRIVVADKGRGIGSAALIQALRLAFREFGATQVWLDFVEHNSRARRLYSNHGFRVDTSARATAEINGARERLVKMTLSRTEFAAAGSDASAPS
jgi:RimJ/RimL family protein N-acetyltransferase